MSDYKPPMGNLSLDAPHSSELAPEGLLTEPPILTLGAKSVMPTKPKKANVLFDNIPDDLKIMPQWVMWNYELKPDWDCDTQKVKKPWTKVPYQPNGYKASVTRRDNWSDFDRVRHAYDTGSFDGIGYVFTLEDDKVGMDMDNQSSGNTWRPDVEEQIHSLRTYGEKSPSGQGVHFIGRGSIPKSGKKGNFEIYNNARFFTVTGHQLEATPNTVNNCKEGIISFYEKYIGKTQVKNSSADTVEDLTATKSPPIRNDETLLQKAMDAKNGEKFKILWEGKKQIGPSASEDDASLCSHLAFWTQKDTKRMDKLLRTSGRVRSKWDEPRGETTWIEQQITYAIERCGDVYGSPHPVHIAHSSSNETGENSEDSKPPVVIPSPSALNAQGHRVFDESQLVELLYPHRKGGSITTEAAHAQRIVESEDGNLCYSPTLGWVIFDGRQWQRDDRHGTQTADRVAPLSDKVREEAKKIYGLAGNLVSMGRDGDAIAMNKVAAAHTRHARQVEGKDFVKGALHFASGHPQLRVAPDAFDQRPWILGFQNGVWDQGHWREHRREDYLLHLSPVRYDAGVDQSEWLRFLEVITGGNEDLKKALQDVAGYALSGASDLRLLIWAYGPPGTGKSTIAELLQTILGKMSMMIDPKKLQDDTARGRLGADIWNRKLVICAEAGNRNLNEEILKTLSGGDTITIEFKYHEAFDAAPRHVLFMVSNDAPQIDTYDEALRVRVVALPFIHRLDSNGQLELSGGARIEAVRKDPESPLVCGFTAWAVEGLERRYKTRTIHRASCIEEATEQFWADADPLTPFWDTVEEDKLLKGVPSDFLHNKMRCWCEEEGERVPKGKAFGKACKNRHLRADFMTLGGKKVRSWILDPKWAKSKNEHHTEVEETRNAHIETGFNGTSIEVEDISLGFAQDNYESVLSVYLNQEEHDRGVPKTGSWSEMAREEQDRCIKGYLGMS